MNKIQKKRCAIYTRKSVEDEDARQEFNSNDAQREAGESYVASQKSNGWVCLPNRYDDYGFSGGNMNRPALKQLIADCESGLIDIIVVYKIDRLSRSIVDFGELSKKFDEWGVSFVAVTQEINTATSAGRMMLNILMTFSQYEREVIAERIRDKMSASRKKGMWVGGSIPFGYKVEDKKLKIVSKDAETVKWIFQRYIEIQSPKLIAYELNQQGSKTKQGKPWDTKYLYRILSNHTYVGEVNYKDAIYKGEHKGIVDYEVWNRVREIMAVNSPVDKHSKKIEMLAPLKGLIKCGHCGGAMMPNYGKKNGRRYYYYLCCKDTKRDVSTCPIKQIPSAEIEDLIKKQLQKILCSSEFIAHISVKTQCNASDILEIFENEFWQEITPAECNRLMQLFIEKAVVFEDKLELEIKTNGVKSFMEELNGN